jgi:hypothetical protein
VAKDPVEAGQVVKGQFAEDDDVMGQVSVGHVMKEEVARKGAVTEHVRTDQA